jgi:hypothetical protein
MSWTSPYENRLRLLTHCHELISDPHLALKQLDHMQRLAPLIPAHFGQMLTWLWPAPADPRDEEAKAEAIKEHVGNIRAPISEGDYALYRGRLLRLCLAEAIAPESVAGLLGWDATTFAFQRTCDDWPLRVVCSAHRIVGG